MWIHWLECIIGGMIFVRLWNGGLCDGDGFDGFSGGKVERGDFGEIGCRGKNTRLL